MKVQAASLDQTAAVHRFEDIYRQWWKPLVYFITARISSRHISQAEDIAAEAFSELWTGFLAKGRDVYEPASGLVFFLGRRQIAAFYSALIHQREATVDLGDALNQRLLRAHSYAIERPDVALLAAELDTALENMNALSKKWRTQHSETGRLRTDLESGARDFLPATRQAKQERLDTMLAHSDQLLTSFREACTLVAELRRDLEAVGGPNWQSSTGMPASASRNYTKGQGTMSEPTRTHCGDGHELTLDNTLFTPKGAKRCRTCMAVSWRAAREARKAAGVPRSRGNRPRPRVERTPAIAPDIVARARQMLLDDPQLPMNHVAALLNVSNSTLWEQLQDVRQERERARAAAADEALDRARALLTDPDHKRSVDSVSKELHISKATLYERIPNLSSLRAEAYGQRQLLGAAR